MTDCLVRYLIDWQRRIRIDLRTGVRYPFDPDKDKL